MSYTYLLDAGEESSVECFSDIAPCALSRLNLTAAVSYSSDRETVSCRDSRFGTTCEPLTGHLGADRWMSLLEDFPARTSAQLAPASASMESAADSGRKCSGSFALYDPASSSWKTHQGSLLGDWEPFSAIWPTWGTMRGGECFRLPTLVPRTSASASSFWPTLNCDGWRSDGELIMLGRLNLPPIELLALTHRACQSKRARHLPTLTVCGNYNRKGASKTSGDGTYTALGGRPNPEWEEWFMGWPIGMTDLAPLATDKFRQWSLSHGGRSGQFNISVEDRQ